MKKWFEKILFFLFLASVICSIIEVVYVLYLGLPALALALAPIVLMLIVFSAISWKNGGILWLLPNIAIGSYTWYYTPLRVPVLIITLGSIACLIIGAVLYFKTSSNDRKEHWDAGVRARRNGLIAGVLALVIGVGSVAGLYTIERDGFRMTPVGNTYKKPIENAGTIEKLEYDSFVYDTSGNPGAEMPKFCYVYLPYNYDESLQYNIMYLMHGGGGSAETWMLEADKGGMTSKNMLDSLIASGEIEPLIVVMPSFYIYNDLAVEVEDVFDLTISFQYELRNDLMPVVESRYSTYAGKDTSPESLIASRDHRAFSGLSLGARTTYQSALCASLDYFSWFAPFSGSWTDADKILGDINSDSFKDYKINYLFSCDGTLDFSYPGHRQLFEALAESDRFTEGENISFVTLYYRSHAIDAWQLDLFNTLHVFFK